MRRCRKEKLKEVQELDKSSALLAEQKVQAERLQAELQDGRAKLSGIQVVARGLRPGPLTLTDNDFGRILR